MSIGYLEATGCRCSTKGYVPDYRSKHPAISRKRGLHFPVGAVLVGHSPNASLRLLSCSLSPLCSSMERTKLQVGLLSSPILVCECSLTINVNPSQALCSQSRDMLEGLSKLDVFSDPRIVSWSEHTSPQPATVVGIARPISSVKEQVSGSRIFGKNLDLRRLQYFGCNCLFTLSMELAHRLIISCDAMMSPLWSKVLGQTGFAY